MQYINETNNYNDFELHDIHNTVGGIQCALQFLILLNLLELTLFRTIMCCSENFIHLLASYKRYVLECHE